ncbi:hypothetical protein Btru_026844 [Bulinus truncatus]|nr:hypothetical protein Btru_026844 [Bulinus truncatus]
MKYFQLMLLFILNWPNGAKFYVIQKGAEIHCDPDIPSRIPPVPQSGGSPNKRSRNCSQGEYLEWHRCSPCPDGTFRTRQMTLEDNYSRCQTCQTPGMYEIVTEPCTRSRDTKIMCEDGLFRYKVPGKPCQSQCVMCDICGLGRNMFKHFVGRECSGYNNTVCCESEDMVVVDGTCARDTKTTVTTTTQTPMTSPKYLSDFLKGSQLGYEGISMRSSVDLRLLRSGMMTDRQIGDNNAFDFSKMH